MNWALLTLLVKIGSVMCCIAFIGICDSFDIIRSFFKATVEEIHNTRFPKLFSFRGKH